MRIFIDSTVLFSACYSATGASREILLKAIAGKIQLIFSEYVIQETQKNLISKGSKAIPYFLELMSILPHTTARPNKKLIKSIESICEKKDAPIVAGAISSNCLMICTLDKIHLLSNIELKSQIKPKILTPAETLTEIRKYS
jgi:predicted nucleic acid-binding protein